MDFKIYKPVREDAMQEAGVETPEAFADFVAQSIAQSAGVAVTGTYADGSVHLHTDDANMQAVSDALERRGLTHGFH